MDSLAEWIEALVTAESSLVAVVAFVNSPRLA